jgi:hypothetical protein
MSLKNKEAKMANSILEQIPINDIIQDLIDFNTTMIERFVSLLEQIESDLTTTGNVQLQGEIEELLRVIMQTADKAIGTLLTFQQELQASIIESYFPAQD